VFGRRVPRRRLIQPGAVLCDLGVPWEPIKHSCAKMFDSPARLPYDKGRYHIQTMSRGPDPKPDKKFVPDGAPEVAEDDLVDIDPADFFDPDEFRINQRRA
jgi:hypothetical protein